MFVAFKHKKIESLIRSCNTKTQTMPVHLKKLLFTHIYEFIVGFALGCILIVCIMDYSSLLVEPNWLIPQPQGNKEGNIQTVFKFSDNSIKVRSCGRSEIQRKYR